MKSDAPNPEPKGLSSKRVSSNKYSLVEHRNRNKEPHKPAVSSRDDRPVQGLKTVKNNIRCNAMEAINSSPKQRKGEEVHLHDEYGKILACLMSVKAAMEEEKQLVECTLQTNMGYPQRRLK